MSISTYRCSFLREFENKSPTGVACRHEAKRRVGMSFPAANMPTRGYAA